MTAVDQKPIVKNASRRRYYLIGAVVVLVLAAVATPFVLAVRAALKMEEMLLAFTYTYQATLVHIHETDGQWPKSWKELQEAKQDIDFNWVSSKIAMDFEADPKTLAQQSSESFTAIAPKGRCFDVSSKVDTLIRALKHYHQLK